MRAVYQPLHSATAAQRQPQVRPVTFVDGIGPPPFDWFDQLEDHLGAFVHAQIGVTHSLDWDEFTEGSFRSGYFGRMIVDDDTGMTLTPAIAPDEVGVHGAASALGGAANWKFSARGGVFNLGADFLFTAKIKIVDPAALDTAANGGLIVGSGPRDSLPFCPSFAAGSDSPNWRTMWAKDDNSGWQLYDTGIPCLPGAWYRLQISRVQGAVRWYVNGQLCPFRYLIPPSFTINGTASGSVFTIAAADQAKSIVINPGNSPAASATAIAAAIHADSAFPLDATAIGASVATRWRGATGPVRLTTTDTAQTYAITSQPVPYLEGQYYPYALQYGRKQLDMSRWRLGPANQGVYVDSLHLLAQRSAL